MATTMHGTGAMRPAHAPSTTIMALRSDQGAFMDQRPAFRRAFYLIIRYSLNAGAGPFLRCGTLSRPAVFFTSALICVQAEMPRTRDRRMSAPADCCVDRVGRLTFRPIGCAEPHLDVTFNATDVAFFVTHVTFSRDGPESFQDFRTPHRIRHDTLLLLNEFLECRTVT